MASYPQGGSNAPRGFAPANDYDVEPGYNAPSTGDDKSPLSGFSLLKGLTSDKKQTKDGQPAKRRGPKPNSKPALTRRQELNRQAQRTHRERKELYIKALEQEVLRLKDAFSQNSRDRDAIADENRRLKELLRQHNINYPFTSETSGSWSGSYGRGPDSMSLSPQTTTPLQSNSVAPQSTNPQLDSMAQLPNTNFDYDQIGIDFVLTIETNYSTPLRLRLLERPCMDHMQFLMVRAHNPEHKHYPRHPLVTPEEEALDHLGGHALMVSGPPYKHILETPAEPYELRAPDGLTAPSLSTLCDLSARVLDDREGEMTPVMAWKLIAFHERARELEARDVERIKSDLVTKVRCYGFGAVLEEFEVRDALDRVLAEKAMAPHGYSQTYSTPALTT